MAEHTRDVGLMLEEEFGKAYGSDVLASLSDIKWHRFCNGVRERLRGDGERERRGQAAIDTLHGEGWRFCDTPACNCGSWHHLVGEREYIHLSILKPEG